MLLHSKVVVSFIFVPKESVGELDLNLIIEIFFVMAAFCYHFLMNPIFWDVDLVNM